MEELQTGVVHLLAAVNYGFFVRRDLVTLHNLPRCLQNEIHIRGFAHSMRQDMLQQVSGIYGGAKLTTEWIEVVSGTSTVLRPCPIH